MDTVKVKSYLWRNRLTVAQMARDLCEEFDLEASPESVRIMLTDMINGRRWLPTLAGQVEQKYGLRLTRPAHLEPVGKAANRTRAA